MGVFLCNENKPSGLLEQSSKSGLASRTAKGNRMGWENKNKQFKTGLEKLAPAIINH